MTLHISIQLSCQFPQILHAVPYKIITVKPGHHKSCAIWVQESLLVQKMSRELLLSTLTSLQGHLEGGNSFLYHIVTGDETSVSFVDVETKKQSRQR
jgi:hypothetical protein